MTHTRSWRDDMTDDEKSLYMAETKVLQLIDHVTSGKPDTYYVYDAYSGYGPYSDYNKAVEKFDELTSGYCYIHLATRIGTGVAIMEKGKA